MDVERFVSNWSNTLTAINSFCIMLRVERICDAIERKK